MKPVVTITGIRPDFIRMKHVFERLDEHFEHIMIHTGQHYDDELSKVFFEELDLRKPDYVLDTGRNSRNHYEQMSYLSREIIELLKKKTIKPEIILFLGDSNSVLVSCVLFKEGFKIGHIEGGMRSYDRRMPEEVNRVICDYVSDVVFVYTPLYKERLERENKPPQQVHVVGNTIVEVVREHMPSGDRPKNYLLADIHRNENLRDVEQFNHILSYLNEMGRVLNMPVKLVRFRRAEQLIHEHALLKDKSNIELAGPYGFLAYLKLQYGAYGVISDSGTSQEECPLLQVPVVVPRLHTERPESLEHGNSLLVGERDPIKKMVDESITFFTQYRWTPESIRWLGDGNTSKNIVNILKECL